MAERKFFRPIGEESDSIISDYRNGVSSYEIGDKFGVSYNTITRFLRKQGVPIRTSNEAHPQIVPSCFHGEIAAAYASGTPSTDLGVKHNVAPSAILKIVRQQGGDVKTLSDSKRIYALDENAFACESPEAKYWFGLLLADGHIRINSRTPTIHLSLKTSDSSHIEAYRSFLKTNKPLRIGRGRGYRGSTGNVGLTVHSAIIGDFLMTRGLQPRKSGCERMPEEYCQSADAWRGLVDGDGWVSILATRYKCGSRPVIGITGSRVVCLQFNKFICSLTGKEPSVHPNHSIWKSQISGERAAIVIRELYGNDGPALERKKAIAREIMLKEWALPPTRWAHLTLPQLHAMFNEMGSWIAVGQQLGIAPSHLRDVRLRLEKRQLT